MESVEPPIVEMSRGPGDSIFGYPLVASKVEGGVTTVGHVAEGAKVWDFMF